MKSTFLEDRAVLGLDGPDAKGLFQGLVTTNLDKLDTQPNLFTALLQPQGKISFDFFIHKSKDGFFIDIDETMSDTFLKKMRLYKLRSDVNLKDISHTHKVLVKWGDLETNAADARLPALGSRQIVEGGVETNATMQDYHLHRLQLGVPEGGKDFAFDDIFPHDAMMDVLNGVDFSKGCFVGQEVVSRVKHRGTARKRFFQIRSDETLPEAGASLTQKEKAVGTMGSHLGGHGLALLRTDRVDAALAVSLHENAEATIRLPDYFTEKKPSG